MTIQEWLRDASNRLADNLFPSARLDAEILLSHTIRHPRPYLHAHPEEELSARNEEIANARLELRLDYVPIAYIIGHKDFYGRRFSVTPSVLVPRPESESLISMLKKHLPDSAPLPGMPAKRLVDIGTGCGVLGITAKLEVPELEVALCDISRHALTVAEKNASILGAQVEIFQSDMLTTYPYSPDIVLANLPYVDESWQQSPELRHEPAEALFADDKGLSLIKRLIDQAVSRVKPSALMVLEADTRQLEDIAHYAQKNGFKEIDRENFAIAFTKR